MKTKFFSIVSVLALISLLASSIFGQSAQVSYAWTKIMTGAFYDYGNGIATDSSGNVYFAGSFMDTVNFGLDFGATDIKTSAGNLDICVTKINPNGTYGWTKRMGGGLSDRGYCIATDTAGNIYVTGIFRGNVNFGLDFGTTDIKFGVADDIFITKINSNGTYGWTKMISGTSNDSGNSVTTDSSGNVYLTGWFYGTVNFGLDFGTTDNKTSAGNDDIFVTRINSNGTYGWTKIIGGVGYDYANGIATDSASHVYITGGFAGTVNFGLDFGTTDIKTFAGDVDIFVTKINSNGSYGWTKIMSGLADEDGYGIATDASGNVYISGSFQGIVYFGYDFGTTDTKTSAGDWDIFVTKINSNGSYGWTKIMGGLSADFGYGIATDSSGNVYSTGLFQDTVNFGLDFGTTDNKTAVHSDIFITKLKVPIGYYVLDGYGGVHAGGGASAISPATPYFGWDIARDLELTPGSTGYYVLDGYGGIHKGGSAASLSPATTYFGFDIAKDLELTSDGLGYYVLDGYGGVHKGGSAASLSPATPYFGWNIARDIELTSDGLGCNVLDGYGGVHAGGGASTISPPTPYFGFDIAKDLELTPSGTGCYVLDGYGGVHGGGTAAALSPATPYFGFDIAKDLELTAGGAGYYVLDGYGGVHAGGSVPSLGPQTPYFGWNIARALTVVK